MNWRNPQFNATQNQLLKRLGWKDINTYICFLKTWFHSLKSSLRITASLEFLPWNWWLGAFEVYWVRGSYLFSWPQEGGGHLTSWISLCGNWRTACLLLEKCQLLMHILKLVLHSVSPFSLCIFLACNVSSVLLEQCRQPLCGARSLAHSLTVSHTELFQ